jgi:hypothetical protein
MCEWHEGIRRLSTAAPPQKLRRWASTAHALALIGLAALVMAPDAQAAIS